MENVMVQVLFFGSLKTYFGNQIKIEVPKNLKLETFMNLLKEKSPAASEILSSCQVAIDNEIQKDDFFIRESSEIAILPPYSGG